MSLVASMHILEGSFREMVAFALKPTKLGIRAIMGATKGGVLRTLGECMGGMRMGLKCLAKVVFCWISCICGYSNSDNL